MRLQKPVSWNEISSGISGNTEIKGKDQLVYGLSEIHRAEHGDLVFIDHPDYYQYLQRSSASFYIMDRKMSCPPNKNIVYSDNPFRDFNLLAKKYFPASIASHNGSNFKVGKNTIISEGVVIGDNVEIGDNCFIHPNVVIHPNTVIKDRIIIAANSTIGSNCLYYKKTMDGYQPLFSFGGVYIDNDVDIGPNTVINKGVSSITTIGMGTKIDANVHIGHGVIIGRRCLIAAQVGIAGKVIIGDDVTIWGQVGITKAVFIDNNAVVQAKSLVTKSLSANKSYFGIPAMEKSIRLKQEIIMRNLTKKWESVNCILNNVIGKK